MPQIESSGDTKYQHQLPTVSFRLVTDDKSLLAPAGVHGEQNKHYGYNNFQDFQRPDAYIRYIEPIESELAVQVEYDMDEQDLEWLDAINAERKKDQSGPISYEVFEIIMDKLEKEWFNLIKRIPQPASHLPVEDSKCAICDDGEGENSNAIVFCDGCNLAVHQDCYGVPYIPEGQWLCRKCTVSPENPVSCLFCPNEGGAFKQTTTGHWSHLLCAIWIQELGVGNAVYMEPVEGVENIPKNRWKLICSICREKIGACIQCDNRSCFTAFHVTCAQQMGYLGSMKSLGAEGQLRAYCEKHLPEDMRNSEDDDTPVHHRRGSGAHGTTVTTKSARAHTKSYRPGPPIVPHIIVQKLLDYVAKISIRKRQPFVERLCRYWSLKREARRGAPLLKRLHLEPWTASNASKEETEAEKAKKLEFLVMLRNDLEKVRLLAELARKREKEKLKQAQLIKDVIDGFIFPHYAQLRVTLEKISAMDRQELFLHPVNRAEVPDYFDVITEPMWWLQIDSKIEKNVYRNVQEFKDDVNLVLDNAMKYNSSETPFHRTAKRIKTAALPLLESLDELAANSTLLHPDHNDNQPPPDSIGDLEPSILLLRSLLTEDPDMDSENPIDRLASIFAFEMEKPKPPTPPPPTPPPPKKKLTEAERRQKRLEREEAAKARIPVRATRASRAAGEAFEQEAGIAEVPTAEDQGAADTSGTSRGSRRSRNKNDENKEGPPPSKSETSEIRALKKSQVGVVGLEAVQILSDKERRERERHLDIVTDNVGNSDLFARFNVGWVLPEGSKRRRVEKVDVPPPKARKTKNTSVQGQGREKASSNGHGVSTEMQEQPSKSSSRSAKRSLRSSPLSVIPSSDSLTPPEESEEEQEGAEEKAVIEAKSKTIKTYDRKGKRKANDSPLKSRKRSKRGISSANPEAEEIEDEDVDMEVDAEEGEEEVEEEEEEEEEVEQKNTSSRKGKSRASSSNRSKRKSAVVEEPEEEEEVEEEVEEVEGKDEDDPYPPGTLVWAKLPSYPFFPAVVYDPIEDSEEIADSVFEAREAMIKKGESEKLWLVRFFDHMESFGWMTAAKLDMLGDDDKVDGRYLAGKEKTKSGSFRSVTMKRAVQKAYREAVGQMAIDGEEEE